MLLLSALWWLRLSKRLDGRLSVLIFLRVGFFSFRCQEIKLRIMSLSKNESGEKKILQVNGFSGIL